MTFKEKRFGNRRKGDRRSSNNGNLKGTDKRSHEKDRRITIINRNNIEVSDRRSLI